MAFFTYPYRRSPGTGGLEQCRAASRLGPPAEGSEDGFISIHINFLLNGNAFHLMYLWRFRMLHCASNTRL
jgi:hypothetical protein